MTHLPTIINDLAMILLVAGVTTILFKKINQPLVLGYIVAGFITGPHFNFFPTITDKANVHAWSEIGVIFLLFALGVQLLQAEKRRQYSLHRHRGRNRRYAGRGLLRRYAARLEPYGQPFPGRHAFNVLHHDYHQSL